MSIERARQIYKLWTEKDPGDSSLWAEEVTKRTANWDELDIREIGIGADIVYISDKWEKPGVLERYHHPFMGPKVYCADHDGEEGSPQSLARLLGVQSLKREVPLTLIAVVEELVVKRPGQNHLTLRFKDPPPLTSTMDKKGLVILTEEKGPIIVRGARMRVTARGIVG